MKYRDLFGIFCACAALAAAPAAAQPTERQYLSGRDADSAVKWEFACTAGRNSGAWTTIPVPSCWEPLGFGTYDYGHRKLELPGMQAGEEGRYRTTFRVPGGWKAKRVFIVFDGVMTDAAVKINGKSAGPIHQGAFYRFKYEITPLLNFNFLNKNELEVSVAKDSASESVNRAERRGDYWNFGGIFRPVWLEAVPAQFIERVAIDAGATGDFALDFTLGGQGRADTLSVTILGPDGKPLGPPADTPAGTGRVATKLADPALWTAETPALHTAVARLIQGGKTIHEVRQRFGFRTIEVRPRDGIYLNGKKIVLKGCDRHSFWPETGRALSERIHRIDIEAIKGMNMNAVRMSHYPPDERFLELCDELGLYVLDELAGWQKGYSDTEHARGLVREMVTRDVNHPCILFWDNGNEGGWNNALNEEFGKWDPQHRAVLHPWELFGGIQTKHYPRYNELVKLLESGEIVMPTEVLHGLYDGGHGAGLEDYWTTMLKYPNLGGAFLWALVDEGVKRADHGGIIDVQGNQGPDGILGPYRQKEGSYFTIEEIWSPVRISRDQQLEIPGSFKIENRYDFTNLAQCKFEWQSRKLGEKPGYKILEKRAGAGPDVPPGSSGSLKVEMPEKFHEADALALTVTDPAGREVWTWVWPIMQIPDLLEMVGPSREYKTLGVEEPLSKVYVGVAARDPDSAAVAPPQDLGGQFRLTGPEFGINVDKQTGALLIAAIGGKPFSLTSEPIPGARWTMLEHGWLRLDFVCDPAKAAKDGAVGAAFHYPEENMKSKTWLGEGPYRVWRNRRLGGALGVYETPYNATQTGAKDWIYPEFAGYFAGVRWMKLETTEGTLTIVNPDERAFVRVGTPALPEPALRAKTDVAFPAGNLAVVRDLPAIGNKFHKADETGPQAATALQAEAYQGTIYLRFE